MFILKNLEKKKMKAVLAHCFIFKPSEVNGLYFYLKLGTN